MNILNRDQLIILFPIFCFSQIQTVAQSMSAPYSVFGIGDIDHRVYNTNSGMGYTGLALKTTIFSVGNNPASVSGFQKSYFSLNLGTEGRTVIFSGAPINSTNSNSKEFTIKKLSFTAKINSFWGSSFGLRQFSNVSYNFQSSKDIEGSTQTYQINYKGDGGLNDYYWNNGFSIGKHISVGITTSLISGSINQTETIVQSSSDSLQGKRRDFFGNLYLDYGFIYSLKVNKKWDATIGGRFSNRTQLNSERSLTVTDNTTVITSNKFISYNNFSLPVSYGAGIAFSGKNGKTFAADYTREDWSKLNIHGNGWQLVSSNRFSVGAEFATFVKSLTKISLKRSFQLGAFFNNSYLVVNNLPINEYGITAGITRSLKNGLMYGLSVEGGSRGTTQAGLIKENYVQFTFSLALRYFFQSGGRKFD